MASSRSKRSKTSRQSSNASISISRSRRTVSRSRTKSRSRQYSPSVSIQSYYVGPVSVQHGRGRTVHRSKRAEQSQYAIVSAQKTKSSKKHVSRTSVPRSQPRSLSSMKKRVMYE